MLKISLSLMLVATAAFTSGCASVKQTPVALSKAVDGQAGRVGVVMTALPKLDTQLPGAGCLLCLAVASVANSKLTAHAVTLSYEDLPKLKGDMASLLRKNGANVTVIEEPLDLKAVPDFAAKGPNIPSKNFSSLQQKYHLDKLLVIDITALGFTRAYSGYLPTSDPKGLFEATGYIVNFKSNTYDWYLPVNIVKSADLNWDEPPKFPGLTNAYFQSLELGRDALLRSFVESAKPVTSPQAKATPTASVSVNVAPVQTAVK
ncbi:hypothetical protein [Rhodoferax sp.]|uniref:hypothetical protein n=1 Tax=Rhodoferax sp. TaxID=50421 RepID=UPI0025F6D8E9|nr:hypothetical protein [Rhodoferax sp.]